MQIVTRILVTFNSSASVSEENPHRHGSFKYTVPHVESIPFTLTDGKEIIIDGAPTPNSKRFSFNLCTGASLDQCDIVLHFNPRLDETLVVLTHKNKGQGFNPEERKVGLPFSRGVNFQLKIVVRNEAYQIYVNNTTFTFKHRVAKENVRYLHILDDVNQQNSLLRCVSRPAPRPVTLTEGSEVYFEGVPLPNDNRFSLDLLTGDNFDTCDTALHFEVRLDEKVVSITHRVKGEWGPLEKHGCFPFKQGGVIQLKIVVKKDAYQIVVNVTTFTFNHRVVIETVCYYVVTGDVSANKVSTPPVVPVQMPYTAPIPIILTEGKEVCVEGKFFLTVTDGFGLGLKHFVRFSFDLLTGENFDSCDSALHFEVRFDERLVRMTHRVKGSESGPVEKHGGAPFSKGDTFQLKLLVKKDAFKIFVNNTAFLFNHRVSMETVRYVIVSGDVKDHKVIFPDVVNLPVSHSASIPFTLTDGKEIFVEENIPPNCNRFSLDLLTGEYFDFCDTALYFEVRFDEKMVCMTHRDKNGYWGPVEKLAGFPFKQGDVLQLKIVVRKDAYQIVVNSTTFTFNHRVAMETVRYLVFNGSVNVRKIDFPDKIVVRNNLFVFKHRIAKETVRHLFVSGDATASLVYFIDVTVPLTLPIPGALEPGKIIVLKGSLNLQAQRFSISFVCSSNFESCDIAFHCDVKFAYPQTVVRTHKSSGRWGPEETQAHHFPFSYGPFEVKFVVDEQGYKVTSNHGNVAEFSHRIQPIESVTHLVVQGCVLIQCHLLLVITLLNVSMTFPKGGKCWVLKVKGVKFPL
ncbi:hypothetical protein Btru_037653 [Bulinus truncatus]|nr:hypothetical protein Btru_037653 [Bulinus truncatus]